MSIFRKKPKEESDLGQDLWNVLKEVGDSIPPTVVTCPQGVVTYKKRKDTPELGRALGVFFEMLETGKDPIAEKIKAILQANPNADLRRYEKTLGVTFIDIQLTNSGSGGIYGSS
jgi:hypothetical protein